MFYRIQDIAREFASKYQYLPCHVDEGRPFVSVEDHIKTHDSMIDSSCEALGFDHHMSVIVDGELKKVTVRTVKLRKNGHVVAGIINRDGRFHRVEWSEEIIWDNRREEVLAFNRKLEENKGEM